MDEATKPCPACGETIKAVAIKCRFCNSDLSTLQATREAEVEKTLFEGRPSVIYSFGQWVVIAITAGLVLPYYWLKSVSIRYQITTQRIRLERGILSTTKHSVELFRIDHFDVHKPLGMRIMGQCVVHLRSSDPSFETIYLYGIPNLETIADTLRECSLRARKQRGITTFVEG